jgi:hypothetical protein
MGLSLRVTLGCGLEACAKTWLRDKAARARGEVEKSAVVKIKLARAAIQSRARILLRVTRFLCDSKPWREYRKAQAHVQAHRRNLREMAPEVCK